MHTMLNLLTASSIASDHVNLGEAERLLTLAPYHPLALAVDGVDDTHDFLDRYLSGTAPSASPADRLRLWRVEAESAVHVVSRLMPQLPVERCECGCFSVNVSVSTKTAPWEVASCGAHFFIVERDGRSIVVVRPPGWQAANGYYCAVQVPNELDAETNRRLLMGAA